MDRIIYKYTIGILILIFSCLSLGYWAGQSPMRMFKANGISCTFTFPQVQLDQPLNKTGATP